MRDAGAGGKASSSSAQSLWCCRRLRHEGDGGQEEEWPERRALRGSLGRGASLGRAPFLGGAGVQRGWVGGGCGTPTPTPQPPVVLSWEKESCP